MALLKYTLPDTVEGTVELHFTIRKSEIARDQGKSYEWIIHHEAGNLGSRMDESEEYYATAADALSALETYLGIAD